MSKINLLFFFLTLLATLSCKKEKLQPTEGTLSLLTYNIAGLPQGISGSNPVNNTEHIGILLNDYQIVQVQEDFNYNGRLYNNTKHTYKTKWSGPAGFGDGLNTLSNYPVTELKRFAWFNCTGADCLTPKGFSYSKIEVAPKVYIDFYNVHCNAGSNTNEDYAARRQNLRQLTNYIKENSSENAVVVMGDFNSRYTRVLDGLVFLTEIGLIDVWIELMRNGVEPEISDISLRECEDPSGKNCEIVDKVFYRSSEKIQLKPLEYLVPEDKFTRNGKWLSDHNPVFVNMQFNFTP